MGFSVPNLGHGIGLRAEHYDRFLAESPPDVDWVEVISENFMAAGGRPLRILEHVRSTMPVVLHGVSLSMGAVGDLNEAYLQRLRTLIDRVAPAWVSDHLCWGNHGPHYAHDLLPMPYTEEALHHVVQRVLRVQEFLGRQILLENVSSYVLFNASTMPEWEFLAEVAHQADCGLLLDVNNVYVSARNHGFSPMDYINGIPAHRVGQIHLAGHEDHGTHCLDTHDRPVPDAVWDVYAHAVRRVGPVSSLVEWDDLLPPLDVVLAEAHRARALEHQVLHAQRSRAAAVPSSARVRP